MNPKHQPLVAVLVTDNLTELEVARGLLESNGIPAFSDDESARLLGTHLLSGLLGSRAVGARLEVLDHDASAARELLGAHLGQVFPEPDEREPDDALDPDRGHDR